MATRKAASNIPPERLELYDRLIAAHPGLERKGAGLPYTSVNGHMFSFLSQAGALGLRLPEEARCVPEEVQDHAGRSAWDCAERVRRRARPAAQEDGRIAQISRPELRVCDDSEAQSAEEEQAAERQRYKMTLDEFFAGQDESRQLFDALRAGSRAIAYD